MCPLRKGQLSGNALGAQKRGNFPHVWDLAIALRKPTTIHEDPCYGFIKVGKPIRFDVIAMSRFLGDARPELVEGKQSHTKIAGDCFGLCPRNDTCSVTLRKP